MRYSTLMAVMVAMVVIPMARGFVSQRMSSFGQQDSPVPRGLKERMIKQSRKMPTYSREEIYVHIPAGEDVASADTFSPNMQSDVPVQGAEGQRVARDVSSPEYLGQVASELGFYYGGAVGSLEDYHVFYRSSEKRGEPHFIRSHPDIKWFQNGTMLERYPRRARNVGDAESLRSGRSPSPTWTWPDDPLISKQWHLWDPSDTPTGPAFSGSPPNVGVKEVYEAGITGRGIRLAVVDDGVQEEHPDLVCNLDVASSFNYNMGTSGCDPEVTNGHGTSCAGLIAGCRNSLGGIGVAYEATIVGRVILAGYPTDAIEASALYHPDDDVVSCSWGPPDDGVHPEMPKRMAAEAINLAINNGRGGKGTIIVWAAGNGAAYQDNVNWDGYASNIHTIAVGALNDRGQRTWYGEPGSSMMVVAPSSGGSLGITTTDLQGYYGESISDYTQEFGGTSAAAPIAAGVCALILQSNDQLTWRDMQHILVHSSVPVDITSDNKGRWRINKANLLYSELYGFGLINAKRAVDLAVNWMNVPEKAILTSGPISTYGDADAQAKPGKMMAVSWKLPYGAETTGGDFRKSFYIEHVQVFVRADTPKGYGKVALVLCSATNTCSVLVGPGRGTKQSLVWSFMTLVHWGEDLVDTERIPASVKSASDDTEDTQDTQDTWGWNGEEAQDQRSNAVRGANRKKIRELAEEVPDDVFWSGNGGSSSSRNNGKRDAVGGGPQSTRGIRDNESEYGFNEWRLHIYNTETMRSEPVRLNQWSITIHGFYL